MFTKAIIPGYPSKALLSPIMMDLEWEKSWVSANLIQE